jgi:hypothetical protein
MTKLEFNKLLSDANLTKKEFSNIVKLSSVTVTGWGGVEKSIPEWVESWLENYIKANKLDTIVSIIKPLI